MEGHSKQLGHWGNLVIRWNLMYTYWRLCFRGRSYALSSCFLLRRDYFLLEAFSAASVRALIVLFRLLLVKPISSLKRWPGRANGVPAGHTRQSSHVRCKCLQTMPHTVSIQQKNVVVFQRAYLVLELRELLSEYTKSKILVNLKYIEICRGAKQQAILIVRLPSYKCFGPYPDTLGGPGHT